MKNWPKLKPYQEELIEGIKKGNLGIYGMGRRAGKSTWARIQFNKWKFDQLTGQKQQWSEWHKSFTLLPKRCKLTGKWMIGNVCVRTQVCYIPWNDPNGKVIKKQYASAKEVFIRKLKNGNTERNN